MAKFCSRLFVTLQPKGCETAHARQLMHASLLSLNRSFGTGISHKCVFIMARPIKETPILYGEDARRFEARMKERRRISAEERARITSCDRPGRVVVMVGMVRMVLKSSRVPRTRLRGTRGVLDFYPTITTITTPSSFIQSQMDRKAIKTAFRNVVPLSSVRQVCLTRASSVSDGDGFHT